MKIPFFKSPDQFSVLYKKLQELQKSINQIDSDMANDRHDMGELKIRMGTVEKTVEEMRHLWSTQTEKLKNTIKDETMLLEEKIDNIEGILTPQEEVIKK